MNDFLRKNIFNKIMYFTICMQMYTYLHKLVTINDISIIKHMQLETFNLFK